MEQFVAALKGRDDLIPISAEATQIGANTQNRDLIFFLNEKAKVVAVFSYDEFLYAFKTSVID